MTIFNKHKRGNSREQIQIKEVVDNMLVLPEHEYRLVIETSSINFELKSEDEQDVIIDSFQNFLNSLPCPIQILVRVREVDIDKYLEDVEVLEKNEEVTTYKKQLKSYQKFVKKLVSGNKILSRRFYIVIPYKHLEHKQDLSVIKEHLSLQSDILLKGLERMQMKGRVLPGIEVLNLFYSFYNPQSLKTQPLSKEIVEALLRNNYV